ncbi:MAG: hypothetical protein GX964_03700 [Syntrophomonadaceae bacterium]|jgi:predicted RND superfamily exporter protein|nr:hypothetical protein [Syntrophomonadaceae bacterium]
MNRLKLSTREKVLIVVAIVVLSGFAFYKTFLLPVKLELNEVYGRNLQVEKQLDSVRAWSGKEQELLELQKQVEVVNKANIDRVPHHPGRDELIIILDELARQNQISLQLVEQRNCELEKGMPFPSYEVKGKVEGTYLNLWSFFRGLEEQPRLLKVERLGIQSGDKLSHRIPEELDRISGLASSTIDSGYSLPFSENHTVDTAHEPVLSCQFTLRVYYDPLPADQDDTGSVGRIDQGGGRVDLFARP